MTSPVVSVVIAAFNAERTLGEQLAALSRQVVSFPFEVLVCDNGSTDGTVALAQRWREGALPQLRVVDASVRRGPGAARNVGAASALSPRLVFCDADDVVADDWLLQMYTALDTADVVAGRCSYSLLNRCVIGLPESDEPLFRLPILPGLRAAGGGNLGIHSAPFFEVEGFDESLRTVEDIDFSWRLQLAGYRLESCPGAVVNIRRRGNLRSVFLQAYGYGRGERALLLKYADVAVVSAGDRRNAVESQRCRVLRSEADRGPDAHVVEKVWSKIRRFRGAGDLAFLAKRAGRSLGQRFGAIDPSVRKIVVPPARQSES